MAFAQLSYTQFVGNSHLPIDQIGCFDTADSNLLEKVGISVDPPTLNTFYESHHLYTYDLTDRANDDITWSTVTKYCPQLVVAQIGTSGFPQSDLAQVEFRYTDVHGGTVTHFCCVNSHTDQSIIDSWDGKVKTPAEYEHVYGQPIAWAIFTYHTPETTPPGPASAPISAPTAVVTPAHPAPAPAPAAPKQLFLPPSVWIWHVYKPGGPYTLPYAIGALDPKRFNGLTYDILGTPVPHVYLIHTQDFGEVAVYAGPDTVAQFPGSGHGEGEPLPVAEVVPAPQSAPIAPAIPAEGTPTPSIVYTRFTDENDQPAPMRLMTKDGAQRVNFVSGTVVDIFAAETPFTAVGKVTLPNGDVYYMNDNDFGIANEIQRTPITVGIKTIFLAPAPEDGGTAVPVTVQSATANEPAPIAATGAVDPSLPWQQTLKLFVNPQSYLVKPVEGSSHITIANYATGDELDVPVGKIVTVAGYFYFGGHKYWLAKSSLDKGTWYGFPVTALAKQDARNTPFETNDDINQLGAEAEALSIAKHASIRTGATVQGLLSRFRKPKGA